MEGAPASSSGNTDGCEGLAGTHLPLPGPAGRGCTSEQLQQQKYIELAHIQLLRFILLLAAIALQPGVLEGRLTGTRVSAHPWLWFGSQQSIYLLASPLLSIKKSLRLVTYGFPAAGSRVQDAFRHLPPDIRSSRCVFICFRSHRAGETSWV